MKNNKLGGMCTSGTTPSIICPLCGKPAYEKCNGVAETYKHFTKCGSMWHIKASGGKWYKKFHKIAK